MEVTWVIVAFFTGLALKSLGLPPMIGYLLAGFLLHFLGFETTPLLKQLAELGVMLLLFNIGLKLHLKDLLKVESMVVGSGQIVSWTLVCAGLLKVFFWMIPLGLDFEWRSLLFIGFLLSLSSTICVLKILQENGELETRHGKVAVSILVLQDIMAVVFLVFSTGETPTVWALLLPFFLLLRPVMGRLLTYAGHGELLVLIGMLFALVGYELFSLVNLKGDLGALLMGMLLSSHEKNSELSKAIASFKDIFLIGFFLSIGTIGLPTIETAFVVGFVVLLIMVKFFLNYILFALGRLRARTSFLSSLLLSNYGELGLIIAYVAVDEGLLASHWLVTLTLALVVSFTITSFCYNKAHGWYADHHQRIRRYERRRVLAEDCMKYPEKINFLVVGIGRVGTSALQQLGRMEKKYVWGMDANLERVHRAQQKNIQAFLGDAENISFWENVDLKEIKLILLAIPSTQDCVNIVDQLKKANYKGKISAVARYEDERRMLRKSGIQVVYNIYQKAGTKFAEDSVSSYKID